MAEEINKNHLDHLSESTPETKAQEAPETVDVSAIQSETAEFSEGVEGVMGKEISETQSEDKSALGDHRAAASDAQAKIQDIRAHILNNIPSERVMIREIRKVLHDEMKAVMIEKKKAEKEKNYFMLNRIIAKLRELTDKLATLKEATVEQLKKIWLKLVHGII